MNDEKWVSWRVKWDHRKYQPTKWTADKVRLFGEQNEGALVFAATAEGAIRHFAEKNRLNPFYLTCDKI